MSPRALLRCLLPLATVIGLCSIYDREAGAQPGSASTPTTAPGSAAPAATPDPGVVQLGSGSASTTVTSSTTTNAAGTTTQTTITIPDPTVDPMGFINTMKLLWSLGWGVFLGGCALGVAEILAWLGKTGKVKALGDGRLSIVIGGAVAILSTTIAALTKQSGAVGWAAVGISLLAAVLAYFNIQKNDPPATA